MLFITQCLREIHDRGVKLALASSSNPGEVEYYRCALPIAAVLCGGFERELLKKAEFLFDDVEELVRKIETIDEYFSD
ncbi:MAG TPA: hypothetical protein VF980_07645 [Thermoanaerobaculia bacterium]